MSNNIIKGAIRKTVEELLQSYFHKHPDADNWLRFDRIEFDSLLVSLTEELHRQALNGYINGFKDAWDFKDAILKEHAQHNVTIDESILDFIARDMGHLWTKTTNL